MRCSRSGLWFLVIPLFLLAPCQPTTAADHPETLADSLAAMGGVTHTPWIDPPGSAQQQFPLFLARTPREIALGLGNASRSFIWNSLKTLGEAEARKMLTTLPQTDEAEFEIWPTQDEDGQPNWVFARWRNKAGEAWQWLAKKPTGKPKPILPQVLDPFKKADEKVLFADILDFNSPYDQPIFWKLCLDRS